MIYVIIGLFLWIACGLVGAGWMYSYFSQFAYKSPYEERRQKIGEALVYLFFGPVGLVLGFFMTGFGEFGWWKWRGIPKKQGK